MNIFATQPEALDLKLHQTSCISGTAKRFLQNVVFGCTHAQVGGERKQGDKEERKDGGNTKKEERNRHIIIERM